jgi:hypothetical protein
MVAITTRMITPVHIKAFCSLVAVGLLADTVQPIPVSFVDAAGRLSLDVILMAGVVALWKALANKDTRIAEKDQQLMNMATKSHEVMVLVMEAVKELRGAVNDLRVDRGLIDQHGHNRNRQG